MDGKNRSIYVAVVALALAWLFVVALWGHLQMRDITKPLLPRAADYGGGSGGSGGAVKAGAPVPLLDPFMVSPMITGTAANGAVFFLASDALRTQNEVAQHNRILRSELPAIHNQLDQISGKLDAMNVTLGRLDERTARTAQVLDGLVLAVVVGVIVALILAGLVAAWRRLQQASSLAPPE